MGLLRPWAFVFLAGFFVPVSSFAESKIPAIEWRDLSNREISPQGKTALSFGAENWKHAETEHFIYHYQNDKEAETVYIYSEEYYKWIKEIFGVSEDAWTRKVHVFVFEDKKIWEDFIARVGTGIHPEAFTTGWELFIYRDPFWLAPQKTLAHELTHVIAFRFLDGAIPIFLNEGFAEFIAYRAIARHAGGNEYAVGAVALLSENQWIPVAELSSAAKYPEDKIEAFYLESALLVRYLILKYESMKFYAFLRDVSRGSQFSKALSSAYSVSPEELEAAFKSFALTGKL